MPRGRLILPSSDTNTPDVPIPADVLLTPNDFNIPHRRCFTPTELAVYFMTCADTITRLIQDGDLRAVKIRGTYKIPWIEVVMFLMRQQGISN